MEVVRNKSDLGIYCEGRVLKFVDSFANRSDKNGREREKAQMEMGTVWSRHLCRGTKCGKKQVNGEWVGNQEFSLKHVNF